MRTTTMRCGLLGAALTLGVVSLCPRDAAAQPYDLSWHASPGGGPSAGTAGGTGVASGGPYTISGTAGQPVASSGVTGGTSTIASGFWVVSDVANPSGADLSLTLNDSRDPVVGNQPVVYTVAVTNNGPATARSVSVVTMLAPGLVFVEASGIGWACHESAGIVTCTRGEVPAGPAPLISIVTTVPASAAMPLSTTATVQATDPDPVAANNSATETTEIKPAPSPGTEPSITITTPAGGPSVSVSTLTIALEGTASGSAGITEVAWTNDRGGHGLANGTTAWSVDQLQLSPGRNLITVTATDANGAIADAVLVVTLTARTYYLTEGATGGFFETAVALANPNATDVPIAITFYTPDGAAIDRAETLPAMSRMTIVLNDLPGLESVGGVSTRVVSPTGAPVVVERTMSWDRSGYGAHGERAVESLAQRWYFAEGSQGFFHTYLLLVNPNAVETHADVQYLRESDAPITRSYTLAPKSRLTVDAGADDQLIDRSFGMIVTFDQPGSAERAMYFSGADHQLLTGGHDAVGETAPSTTWFLAEGATGPFFETFVLLANPGDLDASATLTYLPSTGLPVTATKTIAAHARVTVNMESEDPSLANAAVSTQVVATQPILVERSQYWPDPASTWYEAHNSFGVTALGTKWGLAEGRIGAVDNVTNAQTYILLANPGNAEAHVTITFLREHGAATVTKTFDVAPTSRFTVRVSSDGDVPELTNEQFGAVISSDQPIAVERALYWDANGQIWAAGTNATATRLAPM